MYLDYCLVSTGTPGVVAEKRRSTPHTSIQPGTNGKVGRSLDTAQVRVDIKVIAGVCLTCENVTKYRLGCSTKH